MIPEIKRHTLFANKLLMLFSGFNRSKEPFDEKNHAGLSKEYLSIEKWTSTMIRQMIAYAALSDGSGNIPYVSEDGLSILTGISVKSIRKNNEKFEEHSILTTEKAFKGHISVTLCNYAENIADTYKKEREEEKKEKTQTDTKMELDDTYATLGVDKNTVYWKRGYTSLSSALILKLLKTKSLNLLRLICRVLYRYERDVNLHENDVVKVSLKDLTDVLPGYLGYKKAIKKLMEEAEEIFNISFYDTEEMLQEFLTIYKPTKYHLEMVKDDFVATITLPEKFDSKKNKWKEFMSSARYRTDFAQQWMIFVLPETKAKDFKPQDILSNRDLYSYTVTFGPDIIKKTFSLIGENIVACRGVDELKRDFAKVFYRTAKHYAQTNQQENMEQAAI